MTLETALKEAQNQTAIWTTRALYAEKAMDLASRIVTAIISGERVDSESLFVREFLTACDDYRQRTAEIVAMLPPHGG